MRCLICQKELPDDAVFCNSCGNPTDGDATRKLQTPRPTASRSRTFDSIDDARFVPGTVLAERYRIVGLLGKGGMGEVYRADDLKLAQPVALKFLPERYLSDDAALARFHREVRVARQVSHRNVCRVYDIGEINGQHFLSMEYIKGEELSSLLRRIGRLPSDKALQIARQICAGLAAAHESGVLHRDLKPANVMIDGEGNVRITDFGLAGLAGEFRADEISAGTPAFMAPEQIEGDTITTRSDIYSLGLVLYELFTGKRAYDAPSLADLMALRRSDATPVTPTSIVKDLDPVIERVIDRCIQKDPAERPATALQVAAALPGGDPIAAALAAGETPSPEMVAAAPKEGALKPIWAGLSLLAVLLSLGFLFVTAKSSRTEANVPLEKPPEVLIERAREIISSVGHERGLRDSAYGFASDYSYADFIRSNGFTNWEWIKTGQPLRFYFYYRESPQYLVPLGAFITSDSDPPFDIPQMTEVVLDVRGRLVRFQHLPRQVSSASNADTTQSTKTDWDKLFASAGLSQKNFQPTESQWTPLMYADERLAWQGPHADHPDVSIRIEAAALKNRPVLFSVIFPWDKPRDAELPSTTGPRIAAIILTTLFVAVLIGAALLGRQNLKLGRTDNKGAFRLGLFVFLAGIVGAAIGSRHVPDLSGELTLAYQIATDALFPAALILLLYIALEPHVRKRWPRLIISWTRLMSGNFRDPMIGRDVLLGGLLGICHTGAIVLTTLLPKAFGYVSPPIASTSPFTMIGWRQLLAVLINGHVPVSIFVGFAFLFVLLLFYIFLRREWLASLALFLIAFVVELAAFATSGPKLSWIVSLLIAVILVTVISRLGLLATIVSQFTFFLTIAYPLTTDLTIWYAQSTVFVTVIILALTIYGFYTSLGGQPFFRGQLLRED